MQLGPGCDIIKSKRPLVRASETGPLEAHIRAPLYSPQKGPLQALKQGPLQTHWEPPAGARLSTRIFFPGNISKPNAVFKLWRACMSKNNIKFSDGVGFDTSGTVYHITRRKDGWYVVGRGMLCPVNSLAEGYKMIDELSSIHRMQKMGQQNPGSD